MCKASGPGRFRAGKGRAAGLSDSCLLSGRGGGQGSAGWGCLSPGGSTEKLQVEVVLGWGLWAFTGPEFYSYQSSR